MPQQRDVPFLNLDELQTLQGYRAEVGDNLLFGQLLVALSRLNA
jgi:hypothetical protein